MTLSKRDAYDAFDESLDEEGPVTVAGLEFDRHRILKDCDPIAYQCYFNDWADANGIDTDELS